LTGTRPLPHHDGVDDWTTLPLHGCKISSMSRIQKCVLASLVALLMSRCWGDQVPGAQSIRGWKALAPFIIADENLTGVYQSNDVDALVFFYSTKMPGPKFTHDVNDLALAAGWKRSSSAGPVVVYERFFRPHGSLSVSGSEEARIAYQNGRVAVAWVQADHMGQPIPVSQSSEGRFASENVWPEFDAIVQKAPANSR